MVYPTSATSQTPQLLQAQLQVTTESFLTLKMEGDPEDPIIQIYPNTINLSKNSLDMHSNSESLKFFKAISQPGIASNEHIKLVNVGINI